MKLIHAKKKLLENLNKNSNDKYVIKGLKKNDCALILSPPDVGKSHLCLSIAIELTTNLNVIGLKKDDKALKVVYWPIEDGVDIAAERLCNVLGSFDMETQTLIEKNLSLLDLDYPIASSSVSKNSQEYTSETENNRNSLINILKKSKCDVLIIDTLREAVGSADEVEDDYQIKQVVYDIASKSNCALLLVHHVTKNVAKGNEKLSSVSQSGLSRLGSKSKLHLSLLQNKDNELTLYFTKANYLTAEARKPLPLNWTENGLLVNNTYIAPLSSSNQESTLETRGTEETLNVDAESISAAAALSPKETLVTKPKKPVAKKFIDSKNSQIIDIPVSNKARAPESIYTQEQLRIMALKKAAKDKK